MASTLRRHTPEPVKVRFATAALALCGACVALPGALLPIWALRFPLTPQHEGQAFFCLVGGFALGAALAGRAASNYAARIRRLLTLGPLAVATGCTVLVALEQRVVLAGSLTAIGFGLGTLTAAVAWLLYGTLNPQRAPGLLNLAGAAFGVGCIATGLLAWVGAAGAQPGIVLGPLIAVALLVAVGAVRNRDLASLPAPLTPERLRWVETARPAAFMLAIALFSQAAMIWLGGGWLALYLARGLGMSTRLGLLLLTLFWLSFTVGRVVATRLPSLSANAWPVVWTPTAIWLGCVFLLNTPQVSGAVAGTLLVGLSIGVLHPLTTRIISERHPYYHPGLLNGVFSLSVVGGAIIPAAAAFSMSTWGVEIIIYLLAIAAGLAAICLAAVLLEVRVMETVSR